MKIELFYAPGCDKCAANRENLRQRQPVCPRVEWRELDVLAHMEYAVELGVLTLPAIAIDGVLEFPTLPNVKQFADAIARRAAGLERA